MKKRILGLFMTFAMLLSLMPTTVFAADVMTGDTGEMADRLTSLTASGTAEMGENHFAIPDGGQVFYAFTPQESGQYLFTSGEGEDTYAQLLDENYAVIAEDDDSGDVSNFLISYNLEAGKTYYIGVKYMSEQAGTITVFIERHEHEFGYYGRVWRYDNEKCEDVDIGHAAYCELCGGAMSDIEPHDFQNGYCEACGAVDPNHEHVFGWYTAVYEWDDENCEDIDVGHVACCDICGCWMSDIEPHDYQDNRCTVCDAVDPNHEHTPAYWTSVWNYDEDTGVHTDLGHIAHCAICLCAYGDVEAHDFEGNFCTACGVVNPDHECVAEDGWSYGEGYGHYKLCTICGRLVGDEYDHTYENGRCTVCDAVDPDHEHVFGYYDQTWEWDEDMCEDIEGHAAFCKICYCRMSNIEPHDFNGNFCTVCGAINPDHECVPGSWYDYNGWDEELCTFVTGHVRRCTLCDKQMSTIEPHTYKGDYCTVCGAANPDHECVAADWLVETYDTPIAGHYHVCAICYKRLGDVEPHTFDGNHCTVCDASDPNHKCVSDGSWSIWTYSFHAQRCSICSKRLSELEEHTFEHGRCTVCGDYNYDHVHNYSYCANSSGHQKICSICWNEETREEHQYNADGICTACGWIRDVETAVKLNIRIGENKELILDTTYEDGTAMEMTVTGFEDELNVLLVNNWRERGGTTHTDKGTLSCGFCKNDDGRFYVALLDNNFNQIITSNTVDGCEWYDAYLAVHKANITEPDCSYKNGVWTAAGVAYDGRNVCVTMDDTYNIIGYAAGMLGDVNGDGKVNQKDVARLRQYIADSNSYPLDAQQNADVNNDTKINQKDVARLRQYIADSNSYPLG